MKTTERPAQRLALIYEWYLGMVNARTGMLEYMYFPEAESFVRERSPIRDIASVWDAAVLGRFLERDDLRGTIERSVAHYIGYLTDHHGALILDPLRLREPSSIAHSAFMTLALLALLEAYRDLHDTRWLESAERAWRYYDSQYFRRGLVADDVVVFFANWQSQACRLLFEHARTPEVAREIAEYLYRMHDLIIERGFFDAVERQPGRQSSVAVACALEGLNDAYAVARAERDRRLDGYARCICTGLRYLLALQSTEPTSGRSRGGFGFTTTDRTQRIDVTGHVASAFMKAIENGTVCA